MSRHLPWLLILGFVSCRHVPSPEAEAPPSDRTKAGFPTEQALAELARTELPTDFGADSAGLEVERWRLTGPFPVGWQEPHPNEGPLPQRLVASWPTDEGRRLSLGMFCAAREVGLFQVKHGQLPTPLLRDFIGARCRAADPQFAIQVLQWTFTGPARSEEMVAEAEQKLAGLVKVLPASANDYGIWFGVGEGRAAVVVTAGTPKVLISSSVIEGENLKVQGRVLTQLQQLSGLVTRGNAGFEACEAEVRSPNFELSCPINPADPQVWLDVIGQSPGRWVANTLTSVIEAITPGATEYVGQLSTATSTTPAGQVALRRALAQEIQLARRIHELPPLELDLPQSEAIGQVTPYYFAGSVGALPASVTDQVALGVQAGWKVQAPVRRGTFISSASVGGGLGYLVGAMLARPSGRAAVLDPEARRLAIGVFPAEGGFTGAIVATYRVIEPAQAPQLEAKAWAALQKGRAAFGRAAAERLPSLGEDNLEALRRTPAGDAHRTLEALLSEAAARHVGQKVHGWYMDVDDPDDLTFPQELLSAEDLDCVFLLAHYRPPHEPWTRHVLFVIVPSPTTAGRSAPSPALLAHAPVPVP